MAISADKQPYMRFVGGIFPYLPPAVFRGKTAFFCKKSCIVANNVLNYVIHNRAYNPESERAMKCPLCGYTESKVIDSRSTEEGSSIRRRRECLQCQNRFTTFEIIEQLPLVVIKRDGSRQSFDKNKLVNSMLKSCEKRSVKLEQLENIADNIEQSLQSGLDREVPSSVIGEMVMDRLKAVDEVAYVRFASVYRQFKDINSFMEELTKLIEKRG